MKQKVNFTLSQHIVGDAVSGIILGDFNNWNADAGIVLEKTEDGSFTTSVLLEPGQTYQYRYFLDNHRWENDDRADYYAPTPGLYVENCVVVVTEAAEEPATEEAAETVTEKTEEPAATPAPKATAKAAKPKTTAKAAAKPKAEAEAPKDDLIKIEGIGKQIAALLQQNGIETFAQLSKASAKKLKEILDAAGPKYNIHNPTTWPKQAKLAAAGKWEELDELKATLKGGK